METTREITVKFSGRRGALLLAVLFIAWHPGFLGSETLTLTTYYPAPYGGYVSLLTTGSGGVNTLLARDGGNVLIGMAAEAAPNTQKLDVSGSFRTTGEITGTMVSGFGQFRAVSGGNPAAIIRNDGTDTYMPLITASGDPYGVWNGLRPLRVNNASGDVFAANSQITMRHGDGALILTGSGGAIFSGASGAHFTGTGGITGLCRTVKYDLNAGGACTNGTELVFTWYADATQTRCGQLLQSGSLNVGGNWTRFCYGEDWSGWLLCCRII